MDKNSANFLFEKDLNWESPAEGLTRQIMGYDDNIMLVKICFKKGAVGSLHEHFHSQTSYVVSGLFEVEVKGEKQLLKAGDGFYVEPDAMHGVVCLEDGVLIDVFTPKRDDFLK